MRPVIIMSMKEAARMTAAMEDAIIRKRVILCLLPILLFTGCGTKTAAPEPEMQTVQDHAAEQKITDEQALSAIRKYCHDRNPDLQGIEEGGEYPAYWEVESGTDSEIVVLFRSYTGALVRYHIDRNSGETYVTEEVPGITDGEERTDETLNVRDIPEE